MNGLRPVLKKLAGIAVGGLVGWRLSPALGLIAGAIVLLFLHEPKGGAGRA